MKSVIIPKSVTYMDMSIFYGCEALKTATVYANVDYLSMHTFQDCTNLETIKILGNNVEEISAHCFCGCPKLKTLVLPESLTYIGDHILSENIVLEDIYFMGNESQWDSIEFARDKEYYPSLFNADIHFNSTVCDFEGHSYVNGFCGICNYWQYKNTAVTLKSVKNTTSGVNITWSKLAGADKYAVYRKTTGGWTKLTSSVTGTSYTDKTAKNNVKYTYTVRAINGTEYNTTYNKTGLKITFMSAPKISKVENTASGVKVTWGKVSGATSYNVYRKTTGGWTKLGSTKSTSFTDTKAKAGTKYTYTIIAVKSGANNSSYYSGKAIVRLTVPKLTKLTATSKKNTLTFGKVTGATSYIIYRKTGNGSWVKIATTKSTKYVDTKIKKGTYYTYTVRAVNGSSTSYYNTKGLKVKAK